MSVSPCFSRTPSMQSQKEGELVQLFEKIAKLTYTLLDSVSEVLEMMEEGDAYARWQTYGTWIGIDGRPLAETALASDKDREERMQQKRPTLPLTNVCHIFSLASADITSRLSSPLPPEL